MQDLANRIDDHTIQFVRILPGPIEKVWDYLYDSDKRGEWFARGDFGQGGRTFRAALEAFGIVAAQRPAAGEHEGDGQDRPYRHQYPAEDRAAASAGLHLWARKAKAADVSRSGIPTGGDKDNKVRFTLTHSKIPDEGYRIGVSGGWHSHLEVLQYRAEGKTPPAFWDIWRARRRRMGEERFA